MFAKTIGAAMLIAAAWPASHAMACDAGSPTMGAVCSFAFGACPTGWLPADGRTLLITDRPQLYALLGRTFGGDGTTTFGLPDLRGRSVVGNGTGPGLSAVARGQQVGAQQVTLSEAQVPLREHTHEIELDAEAAGAVSLPVTGTVGASAVTGTISAKALSPSASGGNNVPSATNNTVGRVSGGSLTFFPPSASDVAVPTTFSLNAAGGELLATAAGALALPVDGTATAATAAATATEPVSTQSPALGLTVCVAVTGHWPL